jgi:lipopolysaccharide transport system permease protein
MSRLVIEAGKAERHYWADLWKYRELFYFLSWRDILVRYKQTVIGILWAVLRPVLNTIIFVVVFSMIAGVPTEGVNPTVFVFSAMLPWQFFSTALTEASNSLIINSNMISKIYFPRLIMPASSIIVALTDLLISLVVLAVIMAWNNVMPSWRLLCLIPFTGLAFFTAFGAGLWLAALNVEYRDFRYVVPFIVQLGFFVSPVGYPVSRVVSKLPDGWGFLYSLNPIVGVINGFRWSVTGNDVFLDWQSFGLSLLVAFLLTVSGIWYFRKTERGFADVI